MLVKQKYSSISETFLHELSLTNQHGKKHYYKFWLSVKDKPVTELDFKDTMYLAKIEDCQSRAFKRPTFRR